MPILSCDEADAMKRDAEKTAVIVAGGQGTRMAAHLQGLPKALAMIDGQPLLHRQLQLLSRYGFGRVVTLVGYGAEPIKRACGKGEGWNLAIEYIEDTQRRGTAGA